MNNMDVSKCQSYDQLNIKLDEISSHLESNKADAKLIDKIGEFLDNNQELFKTEKSAAIRLGTIALALEKVSEDDLLVEKIRGYVNGLLSSEKQEANESLAFLRMQSNYLQTLVNWIDLTKTPLANLNLTNDELSSVLLNAKHIDLNNFDFSKYDLNKLVSGLAKQDFKFVSSDMISLISIAKACARKSGAITAFYIQSFGIKEKQALIEIAELCAKQNAGGTSNLIKNFEIEDEKALIQIAEICAKQNGKETAEYIQNFGIQDEKALIQIAKLCIKQDDRSIAVYIQNFGIKSENALVELAELCIMRNGFGTLQYIQNFSIHKEEVLIKIAEFSTKRCTAGTAKYIQNFGITDEKVLIEIAKLCAEQNGESTAFFIKNFEIKSEKALIEIAKLCAMQNGSFTADYIQNFKIENKQALIEIAKLCAKQNGVGTAEYIQNFKIEDEKVQNQLFLECVFKNVFAIFSIDNFRPRSAKLEKIANFIDASEFVGKQSDLEILFNEIDSLIEKPIVSESHAKKIIEIKEKIKTIKDDYVKRKAIQWFLASMLAMASADKKANDWMLDNQMWLKVYTLRDPGLRMLLTKGLFQLISDEELRTSWNSFLVKENTKVVDDNVMTLLAIPFSELQKEGLELKKLKSLGDKIKGRHINRKSKLHMANHVKTILQTAYLLSSSDRYTDEQKNIAFNKVFDPFINNKSFDSGIDSKLLKNVSAAKGLIQLKDSKWIDSDKHISISFLEAFKELIPLKGVEGDISEQYEKFFGSSRYETGLISYAAGLKTLNDPKAMDALSLYVVAVFSETFKESRYEIKNNPHLAKVFENRLELMEKWKTNKDVAFVQQSSVVQNEVLFDFKGWLNAKLITDQHLGSVKIDGLVEYLQDGLEVKSIQETLINRLDDLKKGSKEYRHLKLQTTCIELAKAISESDQIKLLEEILKHAPNKSEFTNDVKAMMSQMKQAKKEREAENKWKVMITDNPIDLLYCGSDVPDSCQKLDGDPGHNKGLLGYLLDGKNKLLAIKDGSGKIVARSIFRILLDKDQPVFYRDRLYPKNLPANQKKALDKLAKDFADELGLPLTSEDGSTPYGNTLYSLGGPAPYEYSDGSEGRVQENGIFTINNAKLL